MRPRPSVAAPPACSTIIAIGFATSFPKSDGAVPCAHVHALLLTKLSDIRARQRELAELEVELEGLIRRSDRLDHADCTDVQICHIIAPGDQRERGVVPGTGEYLR